MTNEMNRPAGEGIVSDGHERACDAKEPQIRAEVLEEYAERLGEASFFKRIGLRREMEREVQRRLDLQAPPDALY